VTGIRSRLTYANVMASIAVFIALGGTGIAAVSLSKNSVGAKQIKTNAVRAAEIKRNAVTGSEIRSNAVAGGDVADGTLGSFDLADDNIGSIDLGTDSVGSSELANNSVNSNELGNDAVGLGELANNSVGSAEIVDGSVTEADLMAGLLDHAISVQRTDVALADNTTQAVEASCLAGTKGVAGGSSVDQTGSDDIHLLVSRPGNGGFIPNDDQTFNDWRAVYRNPAGGTGAAEIRAFIICAEIP
jgi:hypothetical protein